MKKTKNRIFSFIALCIGFFSAGLVACENLERDFRQKTAVVPAGFEEQQKLADVVGSMGSFTGTVVYPSEKDVSVHGYMEGGVPAFMSFLEERKSGINYIYKKYHAMHPGFEGSVTFDITVDVCGDVYSVAAVSSTTGVPDFDMELKNSLSRQKFPKTEQGHYTLSFTLNFVKDRPEPAELPAEQIVSAPNEG